jgi:hypothetical protein
MAIRSGFPKMVVDPDDGGSCSLWVERERLTDGSDVQDLVISCGDQQFSLPICHTNTMVIQEEFPKLVASIRRLTMNFK